MIAHPSTLSHVPENTAAVFSAAIAKSMNDALSHTMSVGHHPA